MILEASENLRLLAIRPTNCLKIISLGHSLCSSYINGEPLTEVLKSPLITFLKVLKSESRGILRTITERGLCGMSLFRRRRHSRLRRLCVLVVKIRAQI